MSSSSSADKIYSNSQQIIPSSLKFTLPKHGPPGTRKEHRIPSLSSTYSTTSDKIVRFHFNSDNLVDFRRGYLSFDLTVSGATGTYARVSQGIWSIFNRLKLLSGGVELEDIREYNLFSSLLFDSYRDEDVADTIGPSCYGYATRAERNSFASATKNYESPLFCGFFLTGIVPLKKFKRKLQLELYLENPSRCIETDSPTPVELTLTNIHFHYEVVELKGGLEDQLADSLSGGVTYPYKKFTYYVNPITSSKSQIVIPHVGSGIETIISLLRRSDTQNNPTINDKFLTYSPYGATQFQLRINNSYFPPEPVRCDTGQAYACYLRMIGKWKLGGILRNAPAVSLDEFNSSFFLIVNQLETHPGEGLLNSITTEGSNTNVYLQLDLSVPPPDPIHLETFVVSYATIDFQGGVLQ